MRRQNSIYTGVKIPRSFLGSREEGAVADQIVTSKMKYVYSNTRNACLVHKIQEVRLRWWDFDYHYWLRLQHPVVLVTSTCGRFFRLEGQGAKMCAIPNPEAVLCGRCHGEGVNFPRGKTPKVSKEIAKVKLGCILQGN